ncbi:hypothetical protein P775_05445 [Puniceibacterium antarcticum]|uniref:HTH luxR-type domain-containing protein n=1 Tax=Puniceibacterium antarcticum TaxID=1206336 RepID=A0A2G8RIA8_9RHOB|nr:LuxR family transcriptional regulator [Puniceibacterium antarcticum]PIL21242.1 hypothetical protein P775_05445 [Puniceibacterium antarcticum]
MDHALTSSSLDEILEQLECAQAFQGLQAASEALRTYYNVGHIVYHWVNSNGEPIGCGTYDRAWIDRYVEKGYLRADPVILGCSQRFQPVDWKLLDWSSKPSRTFQKDAIDHGVGNQGYSIPIRGPNGQFALFTVSHTCDDDEWSKFIEINRKDLLLLAHYFNKKALELEPGRKPDAAQPLSPREIEAMTLLAMGHSRAQAANMLAISENTLRVYIESARHKLGAMNTTHAVARAMARGVIVV